VTVRDAYQAAVDFFVSAVDQVGDRDWDSAALGVWTVRDLVGHTCRSLTIIEGYAAQPGNQVDIEGPVEYFQKALDGAAIHDSIAHRGKEAGLSLGNDPKATVRDAAKAVTTFLEGLADDAVLGLPLGGIRLAGYLPTRTFELTIHTLDLVEAIDLEISPPAQAMSGTLQILVELVSSRGHGPAAALALTGRKSLPAGFSVLG
jgi:uncharacterized protein (TIGR03083 family)